MPLPVPMQPWQPPAQQQPALVREFFFPSLYKHFRVPQKKLQPCGTQHIFWAEPLPALQTDAKQQRSRPNQTGLHLSAPRFFGMQRGRGGGGRQTEKATLQKSTNIRGLDSAGASRIAAPPALGPFPPAGSSALLPERFQELGTRSRHEEPRHLRLSTRRSRGRNPRGCFPSAGRSSAGGG